MDAARRELASIASQPLLADFPRVPWAALENGLLVRGLQEDVTAAARPALIAIVAAAAVLLLIACVNVANLLLARTRTASRGVRPAGGVWRRTAAARAPAHHRERHAGA